MFHTLQRNGRPQELMLLTQDSLGQQWLGGEHPVQRTCWASCGVLENLTPRPLPLLISAPLCLDNVPFLSHALSVGVFSFSHLFLTLSLSLRLIPYFCLLSYFSIWISSSLCFSLCLPTYVSVAPSHPTLQAVVGKYWISFPTSPQVFCLFRFCLL